MEIFTSKKRREKLTKESNNVERKLHKVEDVKEENNAFEERAADVLKLWKTDYFEPCALQKDCDRCNKKCLN